MYTYVCAHVYDYIFIIFANAHVHKSEYVCVLLNMHVCMYVYACLLYVIDMPVCMYDMFVQVLITRPSPKTWG